MLWIWIGGVWILVERYKFLDNLNDTYRSDVHRQWNIVGEIMTTKVISNTKITHYDHFFAHFFLTGPFFHKFLIHYYNRKIEFNELFPIKFLLGVVKEGGKVLPLPHLPLCSEVSSIPFLFLPCLCNPEPETFLRKIKKFTFTTSQLTLILRWSIMLPHM